MRVLALLRTGSDFQYRWPNNSVELYPALVDYQAIAEDGKHEIRIAFGRRLVYGQDRVRILVMVDGYPQAEFFGADDIQASGDVLSEMKIHGDVGERICRYPDEPIPERYTTFDVVGLPTRVTGKGVHNAWAVVANVSDHQAVIALAALRRSERMR